MIIIKIRNKLSLMFYKCMDTVYKNFKHIHIMNILTTLDYINENKCSVSRYGDGEFGLIINNSSIGFQHYDRNLSEQLKRILQNGNEKCLICIPGFWAKENERFYSKGTKEFWDKQLPYYRKEYYKFCDLDYNYGDANISRFFLGVKDKAIMPVIIQKWKKLWNKCDVVIVEGELSRLGVGIDLFDNASTIKRILCPAEDAFSKYNDIIDIIKKNVKKHELLLFALGPTATCLCYDLSQLGYQAIDIGNIDKEYEWYKSGAKQKKRNQYKYSIEVEDGTDVVDCDDLDYLNQIWIRIDER